MKKFLHLISMGLLAGILAMAAYLLGLPLMETLEGASHDAFFRFRGDVPIKDKRLIQVAIGERSLDEIGRWPWPRTTTAKLVQGISDAGALSMGFDIGFFEADDRLATDALLEMGQAMEQGRRVDISDVLMRYHPDVVLAKALMASKANPVLGYFLHMSDREIGHISKEEIAQRVEMITKYAFPVVRYTTPEAMDRQLITAVAPEPNTPLLTKASRWGGYFNIIPDQDGIVRRLALVIQCGDQYFPSLALITLARMLDKPLPVINIKPHGLESLRLGDRAIPVDQDGRMLINYRGGLDVVPKVEACDILSGRLDKDVLKGKGVIITVPATGVMDQRPTPFGNLLPGGDILMQAMDNIMSGDFLVRKDWTYFFNLAVILLMALATALLLGYMHPLAGTPLAAGLALAYVAFAYNMFIGGIIAVVVYPMAGGLLSAVQVIVYRYRTEERDRKFIRRAFQQYLSPSVIKGLEESPDKLSLGGEKKELTVLFSDIRGFTTISESLEPEVLSGLLNNFLDRMTQQVFQNEGVLDKFLGDAVMAFFGAPVPQSDHVDRACRTAIEMQQVVRQVEPLWQGQGIESLAIGVGINTGPMIVGNMGSNLRFDYTVIGDNVNLGSRLEGLSKYYKVEIVVSQTTVDQAGEMFMFRIMDLLRVKGKTKPVAVYELVGEMSGEVPQWVGDNDRAFEAYQKRDFRTALTLYKKILEQKPEDGPATVLAKRCSDYLESPPPSGWDGALDMTSK